MKKLILVLIASMFIFTMSNAQLFNYGIKAGIGFSSLKIEDITGIDGGLDGVYDLVTGDAVMGYHVGLQTRINLALLMIQPELYFNAGGGTVEQIVDGDTKLLDVKFNRIDIPVLLGVKLGRSGLIWDLLDLL
jgi:hypothetical protein